MAHFGRVAADHAPATRLPLRAKGRGWGRSWGIVAIGSFLVRPFRCEETGIKFNQLV
jgi:hypothetical protein